MQEKLFILAYKSHVKAWVAQYRSNPDPPNWDYTFFWGKFERIIMDEIRGFEEEKQASCRLDPETRPFRDVLGRINRTAERLCKTHYDAHELDDSWPLPPQDLDHRPKPIPDGWKPKYNEGSMRMEHMLVVGQLLLSWHSFKYGMSGTRTYYTVSLKDGRHVAPDRWVWNSELPRARNPNLRHIRAIEVVQELSRMVSWKDYAEGCLSNRQLRVLGKRGMEIWEKVGRLGE
jgi:hypothetical protein